MRATAAFVLLLLCACATYNSVAVSSAPSEGILVTADTVHLSYHSVGTGADPVVVVHGFQGFGSSYLAADLQPLARNRTLLFFDQRGDGRSSTVAEANRLGLMERVRDLEALRRHLGLQRLVLLGHSGGAAVALRYAAEYPQRVERLVLVAPPPPGGGEFGEQVMRSFLSRLDSATWARMNHLQASLATAPDPTGICREIASTMLPRAYLADPAGMQRMRGDFCDSPPDRLRSQPRRTAAFQQSLPQDWRPLARKVRAPTLLVHGEGDAIPVASVHAWAEVLSDAQVVVVAGADHLPWIDQPQRFFPVVDAFLRADGAPSHR